LLLGIVSSFLRLLPPVSASPRNRGKSTTGTPTTAASCTAGCSMRVFSISTGDTHSPPTLIMSSLRPSYQ
jgi:hypothetical protein